MPEGLQILDQTLTGSLSSGSESLAGLTGVIENSLPDLVVNVQQLGSGNDVIASFLAQYIPSLGAYSDQQLSLFGIIALLWIGCLIWVLRDAMARSDNGFYHLISALLIVFLSPLLGLPLYLAFRPLVYKWERGVWREALEQNIVSCAHCHGLNSRSHKVCVWCGEPLQMVCKQCHTHFSKEYAYCPECGAPNLES